MIQTDKLVQFYCAQYKTFAKKKHKKTIPETGPYPKRMQRLSKELLAIHSPKIKQPQLENYHRQLRNLSYFVYRDANPIYIMQFETYLVAELVRLDISSLRDEEPELITERSPTVPVMLLSLIRPLRRIRWSLPPDRVTQRQWIVWAESTMRKSSMKKPVPGGAKPLHAATRMQQLFWGECISMVLVFLKAFPAQYAS